MTTHTIELPDPKFQKDDVVRWGRLILHIRKINAEGSWNFCNGSHHLDWDGSFRYHVTVQQGKGLANNPIRPGTILTYSEVHVDEGISPGSFGGAEKIGWDEPIIGPDTEKNLGERWKAWDALSIVEKHGDDVTYVYRGLRPESTVTASYDRLWCVTGRDTNPDGGAGVLEWCHDEKDALEILTVMQLDDSRFEKLTAVAWCEISNDALDDLINIR